MLFIEKSGNLAGLTRCSSVKPYSSKYFNSSKQVAPDVLFDGPFSNRLSVEMLTPVKAASSFNPNPAMVLHLYKGVFIREIFAHMKKLINSNFFMCGFSYMKNKTIIKE